MTSPEPTPAPSTGPTPPTPPAAPPWGDPANFDPEKAWSLIQNLRGDKDKAATKLAELEPLAAKAKELEEAQKTEVQRATERATAAEQLATQHAAETLRLRTALKHGISDEDAALFLTATTEEALNAQAERLAALRPGQAAPPSGQRTPVEALQPGALPTQPQPSLDDKIAAAQKAGNWRAVIALQNEKFADPTT